VVIFAIDAAVIVLGMFIIGDFVLTLLGVLSAFVSALMVDKVFLGGSRGFIAHIVTEKYGEINAGVIERMERTTTILDVVGGYSGEGKKMVMVSFTMSQYAELVNIINERFPSVSSILLNINKRSTNVVTGEKYICLYGDEYIEDEIKSYVHRTLVLELTPEHICGKLVKEA
jgi:hypothetical protein